VGGGSYEPTEPRPPPGYGPELVLRNEIRPDVQSKVNYVT